MCSLHNYCRFLLPNGWVNSFPRIPKITVLDASTTEGLARVRAFFPFRVNTRYRELAVYFPSLRQPFLQGQSKSLPLREHDRRAHGPRSYLKNSDIASASTIRETAFQT